MRGLQRIGAELLGLVLVVVLAASLVKAQQKARHSAGEVSVSVRVFP